MKTYYKSILTGAIIEALSDTRGRVVKKGDNTFFEEGDEYDFYPLSSDVMWKPCPVQDIPFVVHLKDVSNLIQSQRFLDWFNSDTPHTPEETFIFLKENLDAK
jgi:hypothetical protein